MTTPGGVLVVEESVTVVPATEPGVTLYVLETEVAVDVLPDLSSPDVIEIVVEGPQGTEGEKGDTGDAGPEGGYYEYIREDANDAWVVIHNLGRPVVSARVVDTEGNEHSPIITDLNPNVSLLSFVKPIAGKSWLR